MAKKPNAQDATRRNVVAGNKRDAKQDTRLDRIERRLNAAERAITMLQEICGVVSEPGAPSEPEG